MAASDVRLVGLELQLNSAALKAQVDALSAAVDAVDTVTAAWECEALDAALPTPAAVRDALAAYNTVNASISKPANTISDSVTVINATV